MDQNYRNLLLHLQKPSGEPLNKGIPPTLAHYLSIFPVPLPTTLTATAIASSVWTPANVSLLLLAFRNAVHRKADSLLAASATTTGAGTSTTGSSSLLSLSPGPVWAFRKWTRAICSGARNGQAFVRFGALGGVLMGLEDVKDRLKAGGSRWKVEDEVVVAFAEHLETENGSWTMEVRAQDKSDKDALLHIASHVLPLVSESKFRVLDVPSIISQCMSYVESIFRDSRLLQTRSPNNNDTYEEEIQNRLPLISRLASRSIDVLSDNPSHHKIGILRGKLHEIVGNFQHIATTVEKSWIQSSKVLPADDAITGSDNASWIHLKAFLFSAVMLFQSVTDSVLYNSFQANFNPFLAASVLEVFSHLSFISTKFGGVVTRGEGSFREYQRAFYTSLDIVAASPPCGEEVIVRLGRQRQELLDSGMDGGHPVLLAVTAYYLAVVEQLVDQISTKALLKEVLPVCRAYLDKPLHREAFESSHSVILALFASLGRRRQGTVEDDTKREDIIQLIVPFYASSIISCSANGMLNTAQLRLAFSSLVAGASAVPDLTEDSEQNSRGAALVWYCIECLLSEIATHHQRNPTLDASSSEDRYERLVLMLVSLIAAMPPSPSLARLLPRVLGAVEKVIKTEDDLGRRERVIKAIYEEILKSVGDETREVVLRWWFDAFRPVEQITGVESGPPRLRSEL